MRKLFRVNPVGRKILAELQRDGRQSLTDLAERVGLSLSPCHRRVRALEQSGVILGYRAELNANTLGLEFSAMVFVTLREGDRNAVSAFESALETIPQIVEAQRLFGDPDYLLQVITRDLMAFQRLYDEQLSALPNVQRLTSTLVMRNVIQSRALPL
nr:Lrp/AsnC family transcriptional regulator [Cobetia sp. 1CM21F]